MTDLFKTPFGDFQLTCGAEDTPAPRRAWNQADAYLLRAIHDAYGPSLAEKKLAIINDQFGALSCVLSDFDADMFSDSAIFKRWLSINLNATDKRVQPIDALPHSRADLFLLKLPKNLHFFQHILSILSFKDKATVYVAGMQKYWPSSFFATAYDYFSEVNVFPGVKKAKCMQLKGGRKNPNPPPTQLVSIDEFGLSCLNFPNVFSRDQLDIGTRFFLEHFPDLSNSTHILDLACGNGILGIQALKLYPACKVSFIDESYYAIQSCKASLKLHNIDLNRVNLYQNDGCEGVVNLKSYDTVLCNPPFHQQHLIGNHIANTMIQQSHTVLKKGGQLVLIGNRHLQYHKLLRRYFDKVTSHANNSKFTIYRADKR